MHQSVSNRIGKNENKDKKMIHLTRIFQVLGERNCNGSFVSKEASKFSGLLRPNLHSGRHRQESAVFQSTSGKMGKRLLKRKVSKL
jgi:phenylalanyl-tRNA synthetase alpha subunit